MKTLPVKDPQNYLYLGVNAYHISEIVMFQASSNYTYLHLKCGKKLIFAKTIKSFESLCKEYEFLRIHRAYIINSTYLQSYCPNENYVILENNLKATISRRRKCSLDYFLFLRKKRFQHIFEN